MGGFMNGLFIFVMMAKTESTETLLVCPSAVFCMPKIEHGPCRIALLETLRMQADNAD
jgi:hypothetical protein